MSDTKGPKGKVLSHKGMGLVNEVFDSESMEKLAGDIGVGHVRYSTAGGSTRENAQPLVLNYIKGTLALAHNGNLINAPELRDELAHDGAIFQTTIDSEVIAYHIARERVHTPSVERAVAGAMKKLKGAYSLVVMSPRKLIGARDPFGFKPLCIGKRENAYILASESCALDTIGAEFIRDVEPGEIVTITPDHGIQSDRSMCFSGEEQHKTARCIFEYIYGRRQHLPFQNSGRSLPGDGFTGRSGSCCRCTGVRKRSGAWIFSGIGHPIRHCICEKRLCRSDLHQTEAEQPGIERACEAECTARGSRRKACDYDR